MPAVIREPFMIELRGESASQQALKFVQSWEAATSAGLHRRVQTVEGEPVDLWVITQSGHLTLVTDFTRDGFSDRAIVEEHPIAVALLWRGLGPEIPPDPLRAWFPRENQAYLLISLGRDRFAYF